MADPQVTTQAEASLTVPTTQSGAGDGPALDPGLGTGIAVRKVVLGFLAILLAVGVALLIAYFATVRHWLALHTGILNGGPDRYYNFWSGIGSDLGEATLASAVGIGVYTGIRKVNCHTKGCWRIGHHALEGTPYILCRHHHPGVPTGGASHERILEEHRKFLDRRDAKGA
jgi:hypothetical protein